MNSAAGRAYVARGLGGTIARTTPRTDTAPG